MFGIILGGLINGMENEGFVAIKGLLIPMAILTLSNLLQRRFLIGNGSKFSSFPSLKKVS